METSPPGPDSRGEELTEQLGAELKRHNRRRTWLRRLGVAAILTVFSSMAANYLARQAAVSYLESLLDAEVSIDRIRIGTRQTTVDRVAIRSGQSNAPLLTVEQLTLDITPWNGIRNGVWIDRILVYRPQLRLRFSRDGTLLTRLPVPADRGKSKPLDQLPFRTVQLANARIVVHQEDRKPLDIDDVSLEVVTQSNQLIVTTVVPDLFNGNCRLNAKINLDSMAVKSQLQIERIDVSSADLAELTWIPESISRVPWTVSTSLEVAQTGILDDLTNSAASLELHGLNLAVNDRLAVQLEGSVTMHDRMVKSLIQGKAWGSDVELDGQLLFDDQKLNVGAALRYRDLCTDSLPAGIVPEMVRTTASGGMELAGTLADGMLQLKGRKNATIKNTEVHGVAVAPIHIDISVDGAVNLGAEFDRTQGMIEGTILSEGLSLSKLVVSETDRRENDHTLATGDVPLPIEVPAQLSPTGQIRGQARFTIPLATVLDPKTFHFEGEVDAIGVTVNDLVVTNGDIQLMLENGNLSTTLANVRLHDRVVNHRVTVDALVEAGLLPTSEIQAELRIGDLNPATIARLGGLPSGIVDGSCTAIAVVGCPLSQLHEAEMWTGRADFRVDSVRINDELLGSCEGSMEVAAGRLSLHKLHGSVANGELVGRGVMSANTPYKVESELSLRGVDVRLLMRILGQASSGASGHLDLSMVGNGEILTQRWDARGAVNGSALKIGQQEIGEAQLNFVSSPQKTTFVTPSNGFLGGQLQVTAHLWDRNGQLDPFLVGNLSNISLPVIAQLAGFAERTDGLFSCDFEVGSFGNLSRMKANLLAHSEILSVREVVAKDVTGRVTLSDGRASVRLGADLFEGNLNVHATALMNELANLSPQQLREFSRLPVYAQASLTNARLDAMAAALGQPSLVRPLKGVVDVTIQREDIELHQSLVASASIVVRDLRWDNDLWSNQLRANLLLGEESLELRELTGPFAGGRIAARGTVKLDVGRNGTFELTGSRVDLGKLLTPVDSSGDLADGLVGFRVHGRLGMRPSGRVHISMDRGQAGRVLFSNLRVPIDWSLDPTLRCLYWRTTNAGVVLGGGRVVTNAKGRWNGKLDMTLASTARGVQMKRILRGKPSPVGGVLDGSVRLKAQRASRVEDFSGTFAATLSDAQSLRVPALRNLTQVLTSLPIATSFEESQAKGWISNGIVHLDRATMSATNAQILMKGTATLKGRLNIQVKVQTDQSGPADKLLELANSPLMVAVPPMAVVARANDLLKDRVIHLRVNGTAARPLIRLEPARQLGPEAIKFFINQSIAF